jgi:hypothetical protein
MRSLSKFQIIAALALTTISAFALDAAPKTVKVAGWVSDSQCGVDHASKGPNPSCVTKCIKEGAKPIFVDDAKSTVWTIDNPDAVKGHYGHHIQFTGTEDATKKEVHITGVTMLADQGAPKSDKMDMEHK